MPELVALARSGVPLDPLEQTAQPLDAHVSPCRVANEAHESPVDVERELPLGVARLRECGTARSWRVWWHVVNAVPLRRWRGPNPVAEGVCRWAGPWALGPAKGRAKHAFTGGRWA